MDITVEVDSPDGVPDYLSNGELPVLWQKPVRVDPRANQNFNVGLSATLSWPMDKQLQKLCKTAAQTQIEHQQQITSNKRLDFEIARLKNCGELKQKGIMFHHRSPYASICADVIITTPPGTLQQHTHDLPKPNFNTTTSSQTSVTPSEPSPSSSAASQSLSPTSPSSPDNDSSEVQPESENKESSQASSGWLRWPFSRRASPPLKGGQPMVSQEELSSWQLQLSSPWSSQPED